MTTDELLTSINQKLGDLLALYKLVYADEIGAAKARLLGEGTRKKVYELCDGDTAVGQMAKTLGISSPAVSQHLAALADAGLVGTETVEGRRFYVKRLEA